MTRQDKQEIQAGVALRIARKIEALGYFNDDALLRVAIGEPGARKFTPKKQGSIRQRLKKRGLLLSVPIDWEETVLNAGLAVVEDMLGSRVLVLSARDARRDLGAHPEVGDCPAWAVNYVMAGPHGMLHFDHAYVLGFGGRLWMSMHSVGDAYRLAAQAVIDSLLGDEPVIHELPF